MREFSGAANFIIKTTHPQFVNYSTYKKPKKLFAGEPDNRKEVLNVNINFELYFQDSVQHNNCKSNVYETIQGVRADCFQLLRIIESCFGCGLISRIAYVDFQFQVLGLLKRVQKTATQ